MAPLERFLGIFSQYMTSDGFEQTSSNIHKEEANNKIRMKVHLHTRSSTGSHGSVYLGLGIGLGGAILAAMIFVLFKIFQKRREHQKAMAEMEQRERSVQRMSQLDAAALGDVPAPFNPPRSGGGGRRGFVLSSHLLRNGWGTLGSNEDMRSQYTRGDKEKRVVPASYVSFARKVKPKAVPLMGMRLKRLSAIIESPRDSPEVEHRTFTPAQTRRPQQPIKHFHKPSESTKATQNTIGSARGSDDIFRNNSTISRSNSDSSFVLKIPKKNMLKDGGLQNVAVASGQQIASSMRSRSMGSLALVRDNSVASRNVPNFQRPYLHTRSISLGANPPSRPPSAAVPPLPVLGPHSLSSNDLAQQQAASGARYPSRSPSSSSVESASSSVLVSSPLMKVKQQLASPTVEDVVDGDDAAELKSGPNGSWSESDHDLKRKPAQHHEKPSMASVRSEAACYSICSSMSVDRRSSNGSLASAASPNRRRRLSTANRTNVFGLPPHSVAFKSNTGINRISTPHRKPRGTSVSESGSPAERKRSSVLRDISGNSMLTSPSRQDSSETLSSGHSSKGNPFQWDPQPMQKPSALKGSPNARKGHKRQNCVRISTLTPQILGPPSSRLASPVSTPTIVEESGDSDYFDRRSGEGLIMDFAARRRSSASVPNLRVQTLRNSLTPSSPTLAAWLAYRDHGLLPSEHSESNISELTGSARPGSRQSNRSSWLNIPRFPSPGKITVASPVLGDGICLSPTEVAIDENEVTSSPPAMESQTYDPALPGLAIIERGEYDPASPVFPFPHHEDIPSSVASTPGQPDPDHVLTISPSKKTPETSNGKQTENPNFPGAPVLLPPETVFSMPSSPTTRPSLPPFSISHFQATLCDNPSPPQSPSRKLDELLSSSCVPSPLTVPSRSEQNHGEPTAKRQKSSLHAKSPSQPSPQGPRSAPAKSVLQNAMALRRMNSEVKVTADRESRRYIKLGREKSVELPFLWSASTNRLGYEDDDATVLDTDAICNDLFDFDFASGEKDGPADAHTAEGKVQSSPSSIISSTCSPSATRKGSVNDPKRASARSSVLMEKSYRRDGDDSSLKDEDEEEEEKRYWHASSSPPMAAKTPLQQQHQHSLASNSVQATPQSLYDKAGFLKH